MCDDQSEESGDNAKRDQNFRLRATKTIFKGARQLNFWQFPTNTEVGRAIQFEINRLGIDDNESLEKVL